MIINNKKLQEMVLIRRMNVADVSRASGLSYPTVYKALNKEGKSINTETLQKLAKGLGTTFKELIKILEAKGLLSEAEERAKELERELKDTKRELKKAKRQLQPKTEKVNLLLKKYQLDTLKELAEEREESLNNYVCTLIDELVERVEEKREEIK